MTAPPSTTSKISHDPLRIGVIGAGFIAQIAHLYALSRIPEARVVAIAEPHDQLRNEVSRRFGIQEAVSDYRDILDRFDIDASSSASLAERSPASLRRRFRAHEPFCRKNRWQ